MRKFGKKEEEEERRKKKKKNDLLAERRRTMRKFGKKEEEEKEKYGKIRRVKTGDKKGIIKKEMDVQKVKISLSLFSLWGHKKKENLRSLESSFLGKNLSLLFCWTFLKRFPSFLSFSLSSLSLLSFVRKKR